MPTSWHSFPRGGRVRRERSRLGMNGFAHVAIDGPAGSGKTTVARELARRLGILYLDTGAMYRAVALLALRTGADLADEPRMADLAARRPIAVVLDRASPYGFRIYAGGEELGDELYGNDVSRSVSVVAAHPAIRRSLVERQRAIAAEAPVVMAGRDIGTVVLPDAPYKIYLTASVAERVARRRAELARAGTAVDEATLRAEIETRDRLDENRAASPLRRARDAVEVDSSGRSVEDVVALIEGIVRVRA